MPTRAVTAFIIKSVPLGHAQDRDRVFVIASPSGMPLPDLPCPPQGTVERFIRDEMQNFVDLDPDFKSLEPNELPIYAQIGDGQNWEHSPLGRKYAQLLGFRGRKKTFLSRLDSNGHYPCQLASLPRGYRYRTDFVHWRELRHVTIGEAKRMMGFPAAYLLAGEIENRYRQAGNSVMPFMSESIGRVILRAASKATFEPAASPNVLHGGADAMVNAKPEKFLENAEFRGTLTTAGMFERPCATNPATLASPPNNEKTGTTIKPATGGALLAEAFVPVPMTRAAESVPIARSPFNEMPLPAESSRVPINEIVPGIVRDERDRLLAANHSFAGGIYERDAHLAIIDSAVNAAMATQFENRFHVLLWGPPSCAKTEIMRAYERSFKGPLLVLDATAASKAGAEKLLLGITQAPQLILVEEIEKQHEHALRWLLSVLDMRAEVRKVTSNCCEHRAIKALCIATANDIRRLNRLMAGALASRFCHKLYCPPPSMEALRMILMRELSRVGGDPAWIEPTIEHCVKYEETREARRLIAVCLSGREKLLTGEYQKMLRESQHR